MSVFTASSALLEHFTRPRNAGAFDPGAAVVQGEAGSTAQGAVVRLQLKLARGGRIEDARFRAWGCPATIASASLLAGWLPGKSLEDAYNAEVRHLVETLDIPIERAYAPLIVEDALKAALEEAAKCPSA